MIKKISTLLLVLSLLTTVLSLLIVSLKIYTVNDLISNKDRYLKSELKETPYRTGFKKGGGRSDEMSAGLGRRTFSTGQLGDNREIIGR